MPEQTPPIRWKCDRCESRDTTLYRYVKGFDGPGAYRELIALCAVHATPEAIEPYDPQAATIADLRRQLAEKEAEVGRLRSLLRGVVDPPTSPDWPEIEWATVGCPRANMDAALAALLPEETTPT